VPANAYALIADPTTGQLPAKELKFLTWETRRAFNAGETVDYSCERYWRKPLTQGPSTLTCRADGAWSGVLPRCDAVVVPTVDNWKFESITLKNLWADAGFFNVCRHNQSDSFRLTAKNATSQITEIGVELCEHSDRVNVVKLGANQTSSVCAKAKWSSKSSVFNCDVGYSPAASSVIEIRLATKDRLKKVWALVKKNSDCGIPPVPLYADANRTAANVTYKCQNGLEMRGLATSICDVLTGKWTPMPECTCPIPAVPENAHVLTRNDTAVKYECRLGFEIFGNDTVVCNLSNGQWSSTPRCDRSVDLRSVQGLCPFPGIPPNTRGWIAQSEYLSWSNQRRFTAGESVSYSCDVGARIRMPASQVAKISCRGDGSWSGPLPRCDSDVVLSSADWKFDYWWMGILKPSWNPVEGFSPCSKHKSNQFRLTSKNGVSLRISEIVVELCNDSLVTDLVTSVKLGDSFTDRNCSKIGNDSFRWNCQTGLDASNATSVIDIQLSAKAKLKLVSALVKTGSSCGHPQVPLDAKGQLSGANKVQFKCEDGILSGDANVQCDVASGQWGPLPICVISDS